MTADDPTWFSDDAANPNGGKRKKRPEYIGAVPNNATPEAEAIFAIKRALLTTSNGSPRKVVANATTILAEDPRWKGVLCYHALSDRVTKLLPAPWHRHDAPSNNDPGPWTDADTTRLQAWMSREYRVDLGADAMNAAVQAHAERDTRDALKDYFASIRGTWDRYPRVDTWLTAIFNAPDNAYTRAIGRRWLISCVARAVRPGCQVDHVLILEGFQGKGKSSALRALCPSDDLFFDSEIQLGDKDAMQVLRGKWIIELGELSALNRHEIQVVKQFVTRRIDTYRPSFGRRPIDSPRRFVFSGSTNEEEYLRDPTGNRRWWPVRAHGPIDVDAVVAFRDQLWAEALELLEQGSPWHLETEELRALATEEQAQREPEDVWGQAIGPWLAARLQNAEADHAKPRHPDHSCPCVYCAGVTTSAVLLAAVKVAVEKQDRAQEMRVATVLKRLGWRKANHPITQDDGSRVRPYFPPKKET